MKLTIPIPSPEQITVGQFVDFNKADTNAKKCAVATGLSEEDVNAHPYQVVKQVVATFRDLMHESEPTPFEKIIILDGEEYGFEPNLDRIETGAFADLLHLEDLGLEKNLDKYLSILYRRVTTRWGNKSVKYRIEPYSKNNGDAMDSHELFKDFKLSQAKGVCAFFLTLHSQLLTASQIQMTAQLKQVTKEMSKEVMEMS